MSSFKTRLIEEKVQLEEKIKKLESFIGSEKFREIGDEQMSLLNLQLIAMKTYFQCLIERLALLGVNE